MYKADNNITPKGMESDPPGGRGARSNCNALSFELEGVWDLALHAEQCPQAGVFDVLVQAGGLGVLGVPEQADDGPAEGLGVSEVLEQVEGHVQAEGLVAFEVPEQGQGEAAGGLGDPSRVISNNLVVCSSEYKVSNDIAIDSEAHSSNDIKAWSELTGSGEKFITNETKKETQYGQPMHREETLRLKVKWIRSYTAATLGFEDMNKEIYGLDQQGIMRNL
ncbi:uncharacterized protein MELLADRAFT_104460 [Melampsora larici-populina 98AG31]|uniref:Uncharacterized protein n=1 Tax=Melampsora larici-populina (strain 98AG31 / pathotype 3-4-7) TaxID=747676 RepID=F4RES1_MELLP|nr:uncharacterized protein MELLADRAFT_104460 [Melampsora larici-populina 98AG31]EGG09230.1 hypothetical protein MELLADRAFT_104460 [Melampsora larici-populina 98AG31]